MSAGAGSARPTLDQRRAAHAWEAVENVKPRDGEDFGREAKRLPVRVLTAGLGPALAFAHAKKSSSRPLEQLLTALDRWVLEVCTEGAQGRDLQSALMRSDAVFLRRATEESLAYLTWVARLAEARFPKSKDTAP